jgi:palmitoyltransferase
MGEASRAVSRIGGDLTDSFPGPSPNTYDRDAILRGTLPPPPGIEEFYTKDVFFCDYAGLPMFCYECNNWKPDRTHHCSEVNRCVRRMDHYCPWVGGVVSETNMKFFLQFTFYATIFCAFLAGVSIWAVRDRNGHGEGFIPSWIAVIALSLMFVLMAFGLFVNTLLMQMRNLTNVEELRKGSTYFFAVLMNDVSCSHRYPLAFTIPYPANYHLSQNFLWCWFYSSPEILGTIDLA